MHALEKPLVTPGKLKNFGKLSGEPIHKSINRMSSVVTNTKTHSFAPAFLSNSTISV